MTVIVTVTEKCYIEVQGPTEFEANLDEQEPFNRPSEGSPLLVSQAEYDSSICLP